MNEGTVATPLRTQDSLPTIPLSDTEDSPPPYDRPSGDGVSLESHCPERAAKLSPTKATCTIVFRKPILFRDHAGLQIMPGAGLSANCVDVDIPIFLPFNDAKDILAAQALDTRPTTVPGDLYCWLHLYNHVKNEEFHAVDCMNWHVASQLLAAKQYMLRITIVSVSERIAEEEQDGCCVQ